MKKTEDKILDKIEKLKTKMKKAGWSNYWLKKRFYRDNDYLGFYVILKSKETDKLYRNIIISDKQIFEKRLY